MSFVAHFDVDAFYASVEMRDRPSLRGKPVAVAGSGRRAVVLTASYEARPFGVRSAMPLYQARAACAELVVVPPDMAKYRSVSREIFEIFGRHGRTVEGLSFDEAFVDAGDDWDAAVELARAVRADVLSGTQLTVSAGVAAGKMIAKIASDAAKPNGLTAVAPGDERSFLESMPVGRLWGVGPKTQRRLLAFGVATIGDIAALDDTALNQLFGSWGPQLHRLACGIDDRPVEPERETKSISTEETFEYDVTDERELVALLRTQAIELAEKLERENLATQTVGIKIRRADFTTIGRQTHLDEPTRSARRIFRAAVWCLRRAELRESPVRLLGTRVASLRDGEPRQIGLFAQT